MHDILVLLNIFAVPAPKLPEVEPKLVALMLNPEAEAEPEAEVKVATADEIEAALAAPEPKADVEATRALRLLAIVPPSEAGSSTIRKAASLLPLVSGTTSQELVPLGAPDAKEHEERDED